MIVLKQKVSTKQQLTNMNVYIQRFLMLHSSKILIYYVFQTVEEIEGVLGRDLYPNLAEERSRWEKELAGLREENESLTAMLCSKEEELNRTKATMNAIREERDRLRRRVRFLD